MKDPYRKYWIIGAILCFIIYYSGTYKIYLLIRRRLLKRNIFSVLTYHRIAQSTDGSDRHITVAPHTFSKQIEFLEKSYQFSDLEGLICYIDQKNKILKDHILITFDDGYADNYLNALPVLKQKSYPALVFLIWNKVESDENFLNLRQINEMLKNKFEFGSHTLTHVRTSSVDEKELEKEIANSKIQLEKSIKTNIDSFAFPKGKRSDIHPLAERYIKKAGYKAAFTTENGVIHQKCNRYDLNRLGIRECPMFVFKVRTSGIFEGYFSLLIKRLLAITDIIR